MTKILNLLERMTTPWEPERDRAVRLIGQKSPHFTRSGPGRTHNHSGTEKQFWDDFGTHRIRRFTVPVELAIRKRLNRFTEGFAEVYGPYWPWKTAEPAHG